jgi:cation diffusion facilitator family transporter
MAIVGSVRMPHLRIDGMSTEGSKKAIIAAMFANLGIAAAKFVAWGISGSSSLLGEGVHSLADTGNQLLLLRGGSVSKKASDTAHPFGHGRERYVYAFVVSIILFSVGGVFSLYEGIDKLQHPHALHNAWLPIIVLVVAMILESISLRTAVRESNHSRGSNESWIAFVRHAKAPELPVVLLEDVAALTGLALAFIGVVLTAVTGNSMFDALGTIAIGALLVLVAIVLGIETKSLLVGEGASSADVERIRDAINAEAAVESLIHMKTLYLGPEELLVAAKVAFPTRMKLGDVAAAINGLEARVREAVPVARVIYIEPDVYVAPGEGNPSTEAIIIKAAD